jgi:trigger factor
MKKISESKIEFQIEIPVSDVTEEMNRVISQYASRAKVRGFRPGRTPKDMVKRMYSSEIEETVINTLIPKALNKEFQKEKITPVGSPVISELHFKENEPLRFKAQVDVWPEFNLPEYKNIEVEKKKFSVTEKEVQESLEELRARSAQYVPVEGRGVKDGDYVVAEIKGMDKKTKRFLPTEKVVILAGHPENEGVINQELSGLKSGEKTHFEIKYKKDHENKKLAGREIGYDLKVESIKEKSLPDINDDFAKDLGDYKNLDNLKTKIKEQLKESKSSTQRREMAEEIIQKVADQITLELPESIIEREQNALLNRHLSDLPRQNLEKEDLDRAKKDMRERAIRNIKNHLILNKIAENEGLDVSEEEITEEMKAIAKSNDVPLARVVETIKKEGRKEELRDNLLLRKAVDFLVKSAIIK